jgi:hypothetical protein
MEEPARGRTAQPNYDQLYDVAERLEGGELVLERRKWGPHGSRLWLIVRRTDDLEALYKAPVRSTIEAAAAVLAARICEDAPRK